MINRVLIRMKTVQLLYSYLLVEKPFMLESQPSSPTKEKRFAYNLYLDLIYLMDMVAHKVQGSNKSFPLVSTRFIIRTESDEKIKSLKQKYSGLIYPFSAVEDKLAQQVRESLLYNELIKKKDDNDTDFFWENVFKSIILSSPEVNDIIREIPNYTLSGVERMKELMRITFENFYASRDNINDALKNLESSMAKARDLYMRLLALPVSLTKLRLKQLEQNRRKIFATESDINPNMRLVNNPIARMIEDNKVFEEYTESHHLNWEVEEPELLASLLKAVEESEIYKNYESLTSSDLKKDSQFWQDILVDVIMNNEYFLEYLEEKSVFWNDDLETMSSFVVKTLKRLENPETVTEAVMPMYKDGDYGKDAKFGAELLGDVIRNKERYKQYIEEILEKEKWESDRLAFMDVVIMMTAIAEIINYPEIPLTVSINEYIEIAKSYSSVKSGQFIHGLLAHIIDMLRGEGIIKGK